MRHSFPSTCPGDPMTLFRFADTPLIRADSSGRTIHGIAVPYGTVTEVDDGYGAYRERFEQGAFARSIRERGPKVKLFTQHDTRKLPIGKPTTLEERSDGLHVAFAVASTRDGDEALELVSSGVVDGFSVGFAPVRDGDDNGITVRLEAALREVSLVHSPAYPSALVAGVRSSIPRISFEAAQRRLVLLEKAYK